MRKNNLIEMVFVFVTCLQFVELTQAQTVKTRDRISCDGLMIHNVVSATAGTPSLGDLISVRVETNAGEKITFQAHMYAFAVREPGAEMADGEIPASRFSPVSHATPQFSSHSLKDCATSSMEFTASDKSDSALSVFMPYHAANFPRPGWYSVKYRLRVWVGDRVADDYFISSTCYADVKQRKALATYRLAANNGPDFFPFKLEGADDPNP